MTPGSGNMDDQGHRRPQRRLDSDQTAASSELDAVCPACKKAIPDLRPALPLLCEHCCWEEPVARKRAGSHRWAAAVVLLVIIVVGITVREIYTWGKFILESSLIRFKDAVSTATVEELEELGRICNTINNHSCSVRIYSRLLK